MNPISRISRSASRISLPSFSQPKRPASSRPMKILRTTDCCTASARSWNTVSMPASRDRAELQPVTNCPRTRMSPEVGGTTPARILTKVDFPAPLSPMRPTTSPLPMLTFTALSAQMLPKDLLILRSSISRSAMAPPWAGIRPAGRTGRGSHPLSHTFGDELGNLPIVIGSYESGAGIHADRREAIDDLLAKPEDWQVSLHERLLIRG